jgi:mono/diheme cytochrome c family protein
MRLGRALVGLLGVILLGAAGALYLASQPAIPPSDPPVKTTFDKALVTRGAELSHIGNCGTCHTRSDGVPYAGGRPMPTPFGTIYATNITPDAETGIGRWSEPAFQRAMREGVRRDVHTSTRPFPTIISPRSRPMTCVQSMLS